jgi:hypothetical protein
MQIRGLRGQHRNAPVVDRQIALQKPILHLQRRDLCQPQLLDRSGCTLVRIDGQRNHIPGHVACETLHRGVRAFIRIEPGIQPTGRVINIGYQHTARTTPLEPVMVRAVECTSSRAFRSRHADVGASAA